MYIFVIFFNFQPLQKALMSEVLTEMEIRPHDLVPDTNCFINCLPELESLMKLLPHPHHPYVIMVPLVGMLEFFSQNTVKILIYICVCDG